MSTKVQYKGRISGPNHLMDLISRQLVQVSVAGEPNLILLDTDRRLIEIKSIPTIEAAEVFTEHEYSILLSYIDSELDSDKALSTQNELARISIENSFVLDRLLFNQNAWRSAICGNVSCCPKSGRPRPKPEEIQNSFENLITFSENQGYINASDFQKFENIRIRDGFLVYVSEPDQSHRLQNWLKIISSTELPNDHDLLAIKHTLVSVCEYLRENLKAAKTEIDHALSVNPDYSLAHLINRALESDAPTSLIRDAFQAVTFDKLDLRSPRSQ